MKDTVRKERRAIDIGPTTYNHRVVDELSTTFTALADPTRRAILEILARGEASVNELAAPFAMSQQAVSKHLAYLERAQLVKKRRDGRRHLCSLEPSALREVTAWIERTSGAWNEALDRLSALAERLHREETRRGRTR